jgi:tRNA-dihydrouridine synthase C
MTSGGKERLGNEGGSLLNLPKSWLEPLPYGDSSLPGRILPAPLEGLTEGVFLDVYSRLGLVPCWITPFIRVSNALPGSHRLRRRLEPYFLTGLPVVVQLMGTHADLIAETGQRCCELGAVGIDLNCGCPSKTVVRSGAGGAKLREPQWIHDCLVGLRRACVGKGVSIKLRTGCADPAEIKDIMPAVVQAAPDFTIVHFRTVGEQYDPVENGYERIGHAKSLAGSVPILASGDLFSVRDAAEAWRISRCDGVAPARGLLRNPFIIADIRETCRTGHAPVRTPAEVLHVLAFEAEGAVTRGITRTGFLLEAARQAFGVDSPVFRRLTAARHPSDFAETTRLIVAGR